MTETYGAMGNLSWDRLYAIVMEQYAKGINNFVQHGVWYNLDNITYLPELSYRNSALCGRAARLQHLYRAAQRPAAGYRAARGRYRGALSDRHPAGGIPFRRPARAPIPAA